MTSFTIAENIYKFTSVGDTPMNMTTYMVITG